MKLLDSEALYQKVEHFTKAIRYSHFREKCKSSTRSCQKIRLIFPFIEKKEASMPAKAKTGNFKSLSANAFLMSKAKYFHAREPKYIKITFLQQEVFVKLR